MSFRFFSQSIGRKLSLGFFIILTLTIIVGLAGILGVISIRDTVQQNLDQGVQINDLSRRAQDALLTAEQNAANFLLFYPTLGVDKAKAAYADQFPVATKNLRAYISAVSGVESAGGFISQADTLKTLDSPLNDLESGFQGVFDLIKQRGVVDDGLIGVFRTNAHDVEATILALNDADLRVLYLEMRRNEKDYLARRAPQYITAAHNFSTQLKTKLGTTSSLNATQISAGQAQIDTYVKTFDTVVDLTKRLSPEGERFG